MIEIKVQIKEEGCALNLILCDSVTSAPVTEAENRLEVAVNSWIKSAFETFDYVEDSSIDAEDIDYDCDCDCECCRADVTFTDAKETTPAAIFPWKPIKTIPATGDFLLAIATDDGWTYSVLPRDKKGNFIHEGEPTFCHGYYFEPRFWAECPPPPTEEQAAADASDS